MSRKGISSGSIGHHPAGIPHGPHPGTIMASMPVQRTEELAVMFDTERVLHPTVQALTMDDPNDPKSWMDSSQGSVDGQPR